MTTAQRLFNDAFNVAREPRSVAYKAGVLAALKYRTNEARSVKEQRPYQIGTAECDAWLAGVDEGHRLWRDHTDKL